MLRLVLLAAAFLAQDPPAADPPCALFGRLVDAAGAPLAGVTLTVHGWQANSERVRAYGLPASWTDPAPFETDADGKFRVSFVPPRAFQFTLGARSAGLGGVSWRWHEVLPGAELDLGTTTLEPEAVIVGYIVDSGGQLLTDGWRVSAHHNWNSGFGPRDSVGATAYVEPDSGEFRITGLPPGRIRITASAGSIRIPDRTIETKAGEVTQVELRYEGPDPRRKLVVSISTRPFYPFRPDPGTVHAIDADGARIALEPEPGRANDWYAPDVRPGTYRVEIRDPRFLAWTQEDVVTGQAARARLEGSAALIVRVVEADTGAAVDTYALDVGYRNVNFSPSEFRLREAGAAGPVGERYTGIVPGDLELVVYAEGWPRTPLAVDALVPGETREVEVRLVRGMALRGRLVDPRGQPLGGVEVQVTRGAVPGHSDVVGGVRRGYTSADGKNVAVEVRYRDAATETAADGTFQFTGLGSGLYTVYATFGSILEASAQVTLPSEQPVELTAPEAIPVTVRMLLPEGVEPTDLGLSPSFPLPGTFGQLRHVREAGMASRVWRADADGRCGTALLPPGRHAFSVVRSIADSFMQGYSGVLRVELDIEREGELVLDLRQRFPVRAVLVAEVPEAPLAYVHWRLQGADPQDLVGFGGFRPREGPIPPLEASAPPGTYTLQAVGPGFAWSAPEPVTIVRGAQNELKATLPLIARKVQLVDGDGAPRARAHFVYWSSSGARGNTVTDAEGECTLALLTGDVFFALVPPPLPGEVPERPLRPDALPVVPKELIDTLEPGARLLWARDPAPLTVQL